MMDFVSSTNQRAYFNECPVDRTDEMCNFRSNFQEIKRVQVEWNDDDDDGDPFSHSYTRLIAIISMEL